MTEQAPLESNDPRRTMAKGSREMDNDVMQLRLTVAEKQALLRFFEAALPEVEFEVARTEKADFRHDLVVWQELLRTIRGKLEHLG